MKAETIALALGGRKVGQGWIARCPAHNDRSPSLSIADDRGKVLVHCHSGCHQHDVIAALRERGLWPSTRHSLGLKQAIQNRSPFQPNPSQRERSKFALEIWESSLQAQSSPVEDYLASRGLDIPQSPTLRYGRNLKHPAGETWPCMVALVRRGTDNVPLGIHRTFLARAGKGKAPVEPAKMMLGPCRGGAVFLGEPKDVLMVGEGIETCLAVMKATNLPAWAALSTSGLKSLNIPSQVREVIILADGDDPGEAAAQESARRWLHAERTVKIARPPRGLDFNDLLLGQLSPDERRES